MLILIMLLSVSGALTCFLPRIPQNIAYHRFADSRAWLGLSNFWNVVSNLPFCVIGGLALGFILRKDNAFVFSDFSSRFCWILLFAGVFGVGIGSAYYHAEPGNDRLVWDRLPMTVVFMSLSAAILAERTNTRLGIFFLLFLNAVGVFSVWYWYHTEQLNQGDLRLYAYVQFAPMLLLPAFLLLYRTGPALFPDLAFVFVCYALAKASEYFDKGIYNLTGFISGHTIKHLFAALSVFFLWKILIRRKSVRSEDVRIIE
jgi:hypothetical protein